MAKVGIIFKLATALRKINKGRVSGEEKGLHPKGDECKQSCQEISVQGCFE